MSVSNCQTTNDKNRDTNKVVAESENDELRNKKLLELDKNES